MKKASASIAHSAEFQQADTELGLVGGPSALSEVVLQVHSPSKERSICGSLVKWDTCKKVL